MTVTQVLTNIGSFVTESVSWVGSFVGAITSNPLLLIFVIVSFVGLGIGLIGRLIHL